MADDDSLDTAEMHGDLADVGESGAGGPEDVDSAEDDEDFEDFDDASCAERVLEVCLRAIVDDLDAIEIDIDETDSKMVLHVKVAHEDMGKIIGKRGRVANALRTLVKAAGSRDGVNASVEIDD